VQERENCRDGIDFPGIFLELSVFSLSAGHFRIVVFVKGLHGAIGASFSARSKRAFSTTAGRY
jgi:hypothetical protein